MIQWTSTRESLLNNSEYIDSSAENAESLWFSEPAPASHYSTTRNVSTLRQKMQKVYNPVNRQPPTTTQQPGIHRLFGRKCRKSIIWPIDIATVFYTTLCRSIVYSYFSNGWWMQRIQYQSASGQGSENECGRKSASLYVLCCGTWFCGSARFIAVPGL